MGDGGTRGMVDSYFVICLFVILYINHSQNYTKINLILMIQLALGFCYFYEETVNFYFCCFKILKMGRNNVAKSWYTEL